MSLELVQLPKCASVFCNNQLNRPPKCVRGLDRFCIPCRIQTQMLSWPCRQCGKIISQQEIQKIYCSSACKNKWKYHNRQKFQVTTKWGRTNCKRCHGKIIQPYKRDYCSDYCHWVQWQIMLRRKTFLRSLKAVSA